MLGPGQDLRRRVRRHPVVRHHVHDQRTENHHRLHRPRQLRGDDQRLLHRRCDLQRRLRAQVQLKAAPQQERAGQN